MSNEALIEVLERNQDLIKDKRVLFLGEAGSQKLMSLIPSCQSAVIISDNYSQAQAMAGVMGQELGQSSFEVAAANNDRFQVIFAVPSDPRLAERIGPVDTVVLFINKIKDLSRHTLFALQKSFNHNGQPAQIVLIGANDVGGKSADRLVKDVADVYKVDTARKCTVFAGTFNSYNPEQGVGLADAAPVGTVTVRELDLQQAHGLFSSGRLDTGTALLLEAMHFDLNSSAANKAQGNYHDLPQPEGFDLDHDLVLDLGCGSGVIGLSLAARGFKQVLCTDISATALDITSTNARTNSLAVETRASNMLPEIKQRFRIIATNPPFHQGVERSQKETVNMIKEAPSALTPDGVLYLVGNTCLHYEKNLEEAFNQVQVLIKTPQFTVFKAWQ